MPGRGRRVFLSLLAKSCLNFRAYCISAIFENVFTAIESGLCKYGVIPLENSTAGSVNKVYDLMIKHDFSIIRSVRIKVDHNLLAKRGTKLEDIKEIFSHEQAINQCGEFIKALNKDVKITPVENTAGRREDGGRIRKKRRCGDILALMH